MSGSRARQRYRRGDIALPTVSVPITGASSGGAPSIKQDYLLTVSPCCGPSGLAGRGGKRATNSRVCGLMWGCGSARRQKGAAGVLVVRESERGRVPLTGHFISLFFPGCGPPGARSSLCSFSGRESESEREREGGGEGGGERESVRARAGVSGSAGGRGEG